MQEEYDPQEETKNNEEEEDDDEEVDMGELFKSIRETNMIRPDTV